MSGSRNTRFVLWGVATLLFVQRMDVLFWEKYGLEADSTNKTGLDRRFGGGTRGRFTPSTEHFGLGFREDLDYCTTLVDEQIHGFEVYFISFTLNNAEEAKWELRPAFYSRFWRRHIG
jgi:hypothetical protein